MFIAAAGAGLQEALSAQNLLSPQAIILYALALLGVILWIAGILLVRSKSRQDVQRMEDSVKLVVQKLTEISELASGLHDGFGALADEFKFFKEKVMVKLNSNARALEMLPKISESLVQLKPPEPQPSDAAAKAALEAEIAENGRQIASRDERIRTLQLEIENFHKIIEGRSLASDAKQDPGEERERIKLEREELVAAKAAFMDNQERIKLEIQLASGKLRDLQELTKSERQSLAEAKKALEEEKAELAKGHQPGTKDDASFDAERKALVAEIDRLRDTVRRLEEQIAEFPIGDGSPSDSAPDAEPGGPEPAEVPVMTPEPVIPPHVPDVQHAPDAPAAPSQGPAGEKPAQHAEIKGIAVSEQDGVLVIEVGYLEVKRPEAQEMIDAVFSRTGDKNDRILLDFSRSKYINSSGMSAITKVAVERNCQIVLTNRDILKVIDLMGFLPLLNINESFEEAFKAFSDVE